MTSYNGIPLLESNDVPPCSECCGSMAVINPGQTRDQIAACMSCGHRQPFPWPLEVIPDDPHGWVSNL